MKQSKPIATLSVSPARWWFALAVINILALLVLYLGLFMSTAPLDQFFLIALGGVFLCVGHLMHKAGRQTIVLTRTGLFTGDQKLAALDDIVAVKNGMFVFKPSGGFALTLRAKGKIQWRPGLYWRIGKTVGVGGAVSRAEAKYMVDALSRLLEDAKNTG